jgi:tetratricopeptide (TPR) repeat protein
VIKNPNVAAPKFAFGQALVGMADYEYAARVLRAALVQEPAILGAPGSIAAVYREPEEFYVVLSELKTAVARDPSNPDLLFLVVYQYYFSGDPAAVPWFAKLAKADPEDPTLALIRPALVEKFPEFADFPPPKQKTDK